MAALSALRLTAGRCSSLVTGARAWRSATARAAAAANRRKRIMVMLPMVAASDAAPKLATDGRDARRATDAPGALLSLGLSTLPTPCARLIPFAALPTP